MSINLTDELLAKTKKGKIASAKQVFLEGDQENLQQIGEKTHQLEDAIKDITVSGGASTANAVSYNNETSGMAAITAQGAIDELATKSKSQESEIAKKANSEDVTSQMQTEQTRVNSELAKKFNSENITQESGDAEDKVMSQRAVSDKIRDLSNLKIDKVRYLSNNIPGLKNISINGKGSDQYVLYRAKRNEDGTVQFSIALESGGAYVYSYKGKIANRIIGEIEGNLIVIDIDWNELEIGHDYLFPKYDNVLLDSCYEEYKPKEFQLDSYKSVISVKEKFDSSSNVATAFQQESGYNLRINNGCIAKESTTDNDKTICIFKVIHGHEYCGITFAGNKDVVYAFTDSLADLFVKESVTPDYTGTYYWSFKAKEDGYLFVQSYGEKSITKDISNMVATDTSLKYADKPISPITEIFIDGEKDDYVFAEYNISKRIWIQKNGKNVCSFRLTEEQSIYESTIEGKKIYIYVDWTVPFGVNVSYAKLNDNCYDLSKSPILSSYIQNKTNEKLDSQSKFDIYKTLTLSTDGQLSGNMVASKSESGKSVLNYIADKKYWTRFIKVEAGNTYHVKGDWGSTLGSGDILIAFIEKDTLPINGDIVDNLFVSSDEEKSIDEDFVIDKNGYLCVWVRTGQNNDSTEVTTEVFNKTYTIKEAYKDICDIENDITGKTIAVFGDSIMQLMAEDSTSENLHGSLSLYNFSNPSDKTVYSQKDATLINGIIYLTSSLSDGQPTDSSVRLDFKNSNQEVLDSMTWTRLKNKTLAADIIQLGYGSGRFVERGIVTSYPAIGILEEGEASNPWDGLSASLPNEVKMLKRLVDAGKRNAPDLCVIWLGVNGTDTIITDTLEEAMKIDWETLSDDKLGYLYRTKFYGAVRYAIEFLYRNYPYTNIVFVTPVQQNRGDKKIDESGYAYRGYHQLNNVTTAIKEIAGRYSCQVYDALHEIGLANFAYKADTYNGSNEVASNAGPLCKIFQNNDIHPTEAGIVLWTNYLSKRIKENYFSKK